MLEPSSVGCIISGMVNRLFIITTQKRETSYCRPSAIILHTKGQYAMNGLTHQGECTCPGAKYSPGHQVSLLIWTDWPKSSWWLQIPWCQIGTRPSGTHDGCRCHGAKKAPGRQVSLLILTDCDWPTSAWWLLMLWCQIGTRPSATTMLT